MAFADTGSTCTFLNENTARLAHVKVVRLAKPEKVKLALGYCFVKLMVPLGLHTL